MVRNSQTLSVKATFGSTVKRFELGTSNSFLDLVGVIHGLFGKEAGIVNYRDEENELVTISSQEEFQEAVSKVVPKTGGLLKIVLSRTVEDPTEGGSLQSKSESPLTLPNIQRLEIEEITLDDTDEPSSILTCTTTSDFLNMEGQQELVSVVHECKGNGSEQEPLSQRKHRKRCLRRRRRRTISLSSSTGSSSTSGSSSSGSDSESDNLAREDEKRKEINEVAHKIADIAVPEICGGLQSSLHGMTKEIAGALSKSILEHLEGAVVCSVMQKSNTTQPQVGTASHSQRVAYHHQNILCDGCDEEIVGPRYKCGNCCDYDLCEKCEAQRGIHDDTHVFLKLHYPAVHAGRRTVDGALQPLLQDLVYKEDDLPAPSHGSWPPVDVKDLKKARKKVKKAQKAFEKKMKESWKRSAAMKTEIASAEKREMEKEVRNEDKPKVLAPSRSISTDSAGLREDSALKVAIDGIRVVQNLESNEEINVQEVAADAEVKTETCGREEGAVYISLLPPDADADAEAFSSGYVPFFEVKRKPDLVDFDADDCDCSEASDGFVVVPIPKCFDPSAPLDNDLLEAHHQNCSHSHDPEELRKIFSQDSVHSLQSFPNVEEYEYDVGSIDTTPADSPLEVDLVANVPTVTRSQPDVTPQASIDGATSLMDASLDQVSAAALKPSVATSEEGAVIVKPIINLQPVSGTATVLSGLVTDQPKPTARPEICPPAPQVISQQPKGMEKQTRKMDTLERGCGSKPDMIGDHFTVAGEREDIGVDVIPKPFNAPSEKFINDLKKYDSASREVGESYDCPPGTKEDVVARGAIPRRNSEDLPKMVELLTGVVDAAASAVAAVGETVSNAVNPSRSPPVVSYADGQAVIRSQPPCQQNTIIPLMFWTSPQSGTGDRDGSWSPTTVSVPKPAGTVVKDAPVPPPFRVPRKNGPSTPQEQLIEMGFCDRALNERLLRRYNNDVQRCVGDLLSFMENDWANGRH